MFIIHFLSLKLYEMNIKDLTNRCGLSKSTFYHYFKSKEGVIESCYEHVVSSFQKQIKEILSAADMGLAEKLIFFIHWA